MKDVTISISDVRLLHRWLRGLAVCVMATCTASVNAHSHSVSVPDQMTAEQRAEFQQRLRELASRSASKSASSAPTRSTSVFRLVGESDSYRISWDVSDSLGGAAASASFAVVASVGQAIDSGGAGSVSYNLAGGFLAPPDTDQDSFRDFLDNCLVAVNPDQVDTDGDGIGNRCDADFNNDCVVNFLDLSLIANNFFSTEPLYDLDGSGAVNFLDLSILADVFLMAPGPSQIADGC